jgi:hypothetical protein
MEPGIHEWASSKPHTTTASQLGASRHACVTPRYIEAWSARLSAEGDEQGRAGR